MYKIYADDTLIYDSTIEDYKIAKGEITLEVEKAGSFTFSMYPDNPFYDLIVKMKTIITVYRDSEIIFRGRALKIEDSFWKNRTVTCEGAYNFLLDSVIRPYEFSGSPVDFFNQLIADHNSQVDAEKQFVVGDITVVDDNDYIARSNTAYESTQSNIESRLLENDIGGYIHITYDEDGNNVINYYEDFPNTSGQTIEFGENLKDFTKTANAEDIATVIIPLGAKLTDDEGNETDEYLTIADVNNGLDYIEDEDAIAVYGRIVKTVTFEGVTLASNLLTKGKAYLAQVVNQAITLELSALDLHLLDKSIDSFRYGEYVQVVSIPHGLNVTMLCQKQTINLLRPDNDTITLGYSYTVFTDVTAQSNKSTNSAASQISSLITIVSQTSDTVTNLSTTVNDTSEMASVTASDLEAVVKVVQDLNVQVNDNTDDIAELQDDVSGLTADVAQAESDVEAIATTVTDAIKSIKETQTEVKASEEKITGAVETVNGMETRVTALEDLGLFIGDDGNIYQKEEGD